MLARRLAVPAIAVLPTVAGCHASGTDDSQSTSADSVSAPASAPAPVLRSESERVISIPVNRGTRGMRASVRWMLSPDRRSILVVEDPVSVEGDPLPDGFLYASEATGAVVQLDSVWDVAPSPDWTRLAYGRAYVLRAGERDSVPESEWRRVEGQLPEDVVQRDARSLRRALEAHAFPASGMTTMLGLGFTQVLWVDSLGAGRVPAPTGPTHSLDGWRVRWSRSGDTLAVGGAPRMVQDDAPPARWTLVRPRLHAVFSDRLGTTSDSSSFAPLRWVEGATMELAAPLDLRAGQPIKVDRGTIDMRNDTIRITTRGPDGRPRVRVVGPGMPLAATAQGRFIAALVRRTRSAPGDMNAETVVYHVTPE